MHRIKGPQILQNKLDVCREMSNPKSMTVKPYVRRRFDMKLLREHIRFTEHRNQQKSMLNVLESIIDDEERQNISMPVSTCIIIHAPGGVLEFAVETPDAIKHYIFEDY